MQAAPSTFPPPRHLHDASHVKLTEVSPADAAIFSRSTSVREVNGRVNFTPATPVAIDISRDTYAQIIMDSPNLSKVLLPEYLNYYTTAMLWFQIVSLNVMLTQLEQHVLTLIEGLIFVFPNRF